ncbi:MAG: hypothetical protein K9G49_03020 [Taibaiella sp.]|nr:hypothetical protein [Taibaiella sp.]
MNKRKKICKNCFDTKGDFLFVSGGDGRCKMCKGTGISHELGDSAATIVTLGFINYNRECRYCYGTGQCQTCGGTGSIYIENAPYISYDEPEPIQIDKDLNESEGLDKINPHYDPYELDEECDYCDGTEHCSFCGRKGDDHFEDIAYSGYENSSSAKFDKNYQDYFANEIKNSNEFDSTIDTNTNSHYKDNLHIDLTELQKKIENNEIELSQVIEKIDLKKKDLPGEAFLLFIVFSFVGGFISYAIQEIPKHPPHQINWGAVYFIAISGIVIFVFLLLSYLGSRSELSDLKKRKQILDTKNTKLKK